MSSSSIRTQSYQLSHSFIWIKNDRLFEKKNHLIGISVKHMFTFTYNFFSFQWNNVRMSRSVKLSFNRSLDYFVDRENGAQYELILSRLFLFKKIGAKMPPSLDAIIIKWLLARDMILITMWIFLGLWVSQRLSLRQTFTST